ncbi:MAG: LamG domain-containing protein [Lentisphaerae bacterium]|nr:LamG domain-containing protein [Lentisphaerota bacterium]
MKQYFTALLLAACSLLAASCLEPIGAWDFEKVEANKVRATAGPDGKIINPGKNARLVPGRSGGNALYIGGGWTAADRNKVGALVIPNFAPRPDKPFTAVFDFKIDHDPKNKNFRKFKTLLEAANGERGPGFRVYIFYGSLQFRTGDGKKNMKHVTASSATVRIPAGRWARMAVVYTGKTASLYMDGVRIGHGDMQIVPGTQKNLTFGSYRAGFANPATAAYDNIAVYDRALSAGEIAGDYLETLKKDHQ